MYKPKNTSGLTDGIETPDDGQDLQPGERARLASLMLRLGYSEDDVLPDLVEEQLRTLPRRIKIHDAHAVHLHKADSGQKAKLAAESYLKGEGSLAQICAAYQVTERTLSRAIARLRAQEASIHE
jgi:hypothetical protein